VRISKKRKTNGVPERQVHDKTGGFLAPKKKQPKKKRKKTGPRQRRGGRRGMASGKKNTVGKDVLS